MCFLIFCNFLSPGGPRITNFHGPTSKEFFWFLSATNSSSLSLSFFVRSFDIATLLILSFADPFKIFEFLRKNFLLSIEAKETTAGRGLSLKFVPLVPYLIILSIFISSSDSTYNLLYHFF